MENEMSSPVSALSNTGVVAFFHRRKFFKRRHDHESAICVPPERLRVEGEGVSFLYSAAHGMDKAEVAFLRVRADSVLKTGQTFHSSANTRSSVWMCAALCAALIQAPSKALRASW